MVPSVREARILLDKEGAFCALQQEAKVWTWEPLQAEANYYASNVLKDGEPKDSCCTGLYSEDFFPLACRELGFPTLEFLPGHDPFLQIATTLSKLSLIITLPNSG